ncbi:hypothetical protein BV96_01788 [Sphingomonas paucimobilis]|nr:hypothetical protein BV96_01788 [Sphingomonas paucimobilis]
MRAIIISAVLLSACNQNEVGKEPALAWEVMKDGSQVAIGSTDKDSSDANQIVRCWKTGSAFDCLSVSGDDWRSVRRIKAASLPHKVEPEGNPPGYDCDVGSVSSGFQEHIFGPHGRLTQNVIANLLGPMDRGWSKSYVERYFEANSVKPETVWFDCRNAARVIQNGSNAAIASTSLTLAMLDGKEEAQD